MDKKSLKVKIIGNGGAINDGLPYNAFVINDSLLCETPPDIMLSINKNGIDLSSIKTIYISHLHGDHIFGLPFLVLSAFYRHQAISKKFSFKIIGPAGLGKKAEEIFISAFTEEHPGLAWMQDFCTFLEINETSEPVLVDGFRSSFFELDHLIETYGFSLAGDNNRIDFVYVADTRWCEVVNKLLSKKPKTVLIDLNGKDDDPAPIHISLEDLIKKGIPLTGEDTKYYGTHLKDEFESTIPCVVCTKPGMEIKV